MAKMFFRYSSMGAGKTLDLLKTYYNYEERGKYPIIFTSIKDNRYGENKVKSRTGLERTAVAVSDETNLFEIVKNHEKIIDCVLVDEVQFFKKHHIYELSDVVDILNIPVIAYGLRSDFKTFPFEGSIYMLTLADEIEELKTLCYNCEKKAILNIRYSTKKGLLGWVKDIIVEGEQVQVGGNESYMPLCRKCYKELLELTLKRKNKDTNIIPEGIYCYTGIKYEKGVYHIKNCPYYDKVENGGSQSDGYCHYLDISDDSLNKESCFIDEKTGEEFTAKELGLPIGGLLWDSCKECGVNDD